MAKIEAAASVQIDGVMLTERQLGVLMAVYANGSQRAAARSLGISPQVLNRYVKQIERKIGMAVLTPGARGSVLNEIGEGIAREGMAIKLRLGKERRTTVGCTPLSEGRVLAGLNDVDRNGTFDLIISDDGRNMRDFDAGLMDMVVLDDPLYAFESDLHEWRPIGSDRLVHARKGRQYARFRYGAYRLGLRHLESIGEDYEMVRVYSSLSALLDSKYSFFIEESLLSRRGLKLRSHTDPAKLEHIIIAILRPGSPGAERLLDAMVVQGGV